MERACQFLFVYGSVSFGVGVGLQIFGLNPCTLNEWRKREPEVTLPFLFSVLWANVESDKMDRI